MKLLFLACKPAIYVLIPMIVLMKNFTEGTRQDQSAWNTFAVAGIGAAISMVWMIGINQLAANGISIPFIFWVAATINGIVTLLAYVLAICTVTIRSLIWLNQNAPNIQVSIKKPE